MLISLYFQDGWDCVNIDECADDISPCHVSAWCIDTVGSYYCECDAAHEGDGFSCTGECHGYD